MGLAVGDAREIPLADESVQCCITSPPYWGLRDYGTGRWEGGDAECEHSVGGQVPDTKALGAITAGVRPGVDASTCRKCGARRIDRQIGLEQSPDEYVAQMVAVFREVRRVLRRDGTVWLNLGDSYAGSWGDSGHRPDRTGLAGHQREKTTEWFKRNGHPQASKPVTASVRGLKPKDMVGIPWRVAFALQADGWWLRSDIIWAKGVSFCPTYSGSVMPESVRDRPTQSYEHVFLLAKSRSYYYDAMAVRENVISEPHSPGNLTLTQPENKGARDPAYDPDRTWGSATGRNLRSVWTINPKPSRLKHYAAFPPALVEPMVLAGTSAKGDVVLDPFGGTMTVGQVCAKHGRRFVGLDLKAEYVEMGRERCATVQTAYAL